jgi:hypothetical protein
MYELLFAPPWYYEAAVLVAGVALLFYALRQGASAPRKVALGLITAGLAWAALDWAVVTPSEAATSGSKRFAAAVVSRDSGAIRALLSPNVSLVRLGREDIATMLPQYADEWGVKSATITDTQIEERGPEVVASIHVFSQHDNPKVPISTLTSDWQLIWVNEQGAWRITQIVPVKIGTADLQGITEKYFSGKSR